MNLADRTNVPPSGIREFFDLVQSQDDIITLGVGEPDFVTPWGVRESCIYSLERGNTSYTSNKGKISLRRLISDSMEKRTGNRYRPESEVLVTSGVSEGVDLAIRSLIDPGEEVIVIQPSYVSYIPTIKFSGGKANKVFSSLEKGFKPDPAEIDSVCGKKTKAIILNYPNNPTGAVLNKKEAEEIVKVIKENNLVLISDEVYSYLTYGSKHISLASFPRMRERTVLLDGFSKYFAMTGWRLGFALGPPQIIETMNKIHQYTMICAPITAQNAGEEALQNGWPEAEKMRKEFNKRRRLVLKGLRDAGLELREPKGGFYMFPNISKTGLDGETFAEELLKEERVAVVPGSAFGKKFKDHIRISYAASKKDLKTALERIKRFISSKN